MQQGRRIKCAVEISLELNTGNGLLEPTQRAEPKVRLCMSTKVYLVGIIVAVVVAVAAVR